MRHDVTSIAACIARVQALGLIVEARGGAAHTWDGGWQRDVAPWARAPGREWPTFVVPLDAAAGSDRALCWVSDACVDDMAWLRFERAWASPIAAGADGLVYLADALDTVRPTIEVCAKVLAALGPAVTAGPDERPVSLARAADVLGWTVEALRAAVKRGDVRTVKDGARRAVPMSEIARLIG